MDSRNGNDQFIHAMFVVNQRAIIDFALHDGPQYVQIPKFQDVSKANLVIVEALLIHVNDVEMKHELDGFVQRHALRYFGVTFFRTCGN